jgi:hypothetical protein
LNSRSSGGGKNICVTICGEALEESSLLYFRKQRNVEVYCPEDIILRVALISGRNSKIRIPVA